MPSVIPPSPTLDDQFFWDAIAEGRLVFQRCTACGIVRHPPAPMCGECHSVEWDTQESSRHGHVYTWIVSHHPDQARRRAARRGAGRARRRHPLRVQPPRHRCRRGEQRDRGRGEHRRRRRRGPAPVPPGPAWRRRDGAVTRHRHRRHRPDRVLQALGPQRAPARGRSGGGGDRRRRAHARRHRRRGHVHHGRQRRAGGDALRRASLAPLHRPHARRWGGAGATVQHASAAVASGAADAVLVYRAFNERSGRRFGQPISENNKSRVVPPGGTGTCRSGSTRRPRCTRSGTSATCTSTA